MENTKLSIDKLRPEQLKILNDLIEIIEELEGDGHFPLSEDPENYADVKLQILEMVYENTQKVIDRPQLLGGLVKILVNYDVLAFESIPLSIRFLAVAHT